MSTSPHRKNIADLTVGETIENLQFMLGQISIAKDSAPAVHYIGQNYRLHLLHLEAKRQYKTAVKYQESWDEMIK